MLVKLLKHDLHAFFNKLLVLYASLLITTLVLRMVIEFNSNFFIGFLSPIAVVLFIATLAATEIAGWGLPIFHFYQNMFKDEGYLTNTLPIKTENLLLSKLISSYFSIVLTTTICIVCLLMVDKNLQFTQQMMNTINMNSFIPYIILVLTLAPLSTITLFFVTLSIGQSANQNKTVATLVTGMCVYFINQLVNIGVVVISLFLFYLSLQTKQSFFNVISDHDLLQTYFNPNSFISYLVVAQGIVAVFFIIIGWFIIINILNNKLNLD